MVDAVQFDRHFVEPSSQELLFDPVLVVPSILWASLLIVECSSHRGERSGSWNLGKSFLDHGNPAEDLPGRERVLAPRFEYAMQF
jgi:hypothetical protein